MSLYSFDDGTEARVIGVGTNPDGTVYVRQTSNGDLTQFAFGSVQHTETITFSPTEAYGLEDVENDIESRGSEFFIDDVADSLRLWGVPFDRQTSDDAQDTRRSDASHTRPATS